MVTCDQEPAYIVGPGLSPSGYGIEEVFAGRENVVLSSIVGLCT